MTTLKEPAGSPEAQVRRPRALIFTVYGLYARESGGWLSVASLVRLMVELAVDEPAVRSSISRLKRRGILASQRVDGVAGYSLSDEGRAMLNEGDRRIFERPRANMSDGWMLAVFSVPESERQKRHLLRSRLSWLGFGTVSSGAWIAPAHLYEETCDVLDRYGLKSYVDLFGGDYLAFGDVAEKVRSWWDLPGLQQLYDEFLDTYSPVLAGWRRRRSENDAAAFGDYVAALTAWRRLPFLDPGLPQVVLPKNWHGVRAANLFDALRKRLTEPAHRHVLAVTARDPKAVAARLQPRISQA